ncbi:uncharacterized protein LY89DRAFT_736524 [Mollisia scopiformis]|uniref:C2H2-type domain-containing protein n=1 Tax=Mollisia scopiformis TaxID=149040 RepID=A0A194X2S8_MOLSC|nr:uncharacterized protein LY89DRAFT_736524 [Mollisia scopiformis]KUJ14491.1 hypothetical protein LY89DRAFT_736524 [Mollisia scopiformis]
MLLLDHFENGTQESWGVDNIVTSQDGSRNLMTRMQGLLSGHTFESSIKPSESEYRRLRCSLEEMVKSLGNLNLSWDQSCRDIVKSLVAGDSKIMPHNNYYLADTRTEKDNSNLYEQSTAFPVETPFLPSVSSSSKPGIVSLATKRATFTPAEAIVTGQDMKVLSHIPTSIEDAVLKGSLEEQKHYLVDRVIGEFWKKYKHHFVSYGNVVSDSSSLPEQEYNNNSSISSITDPVSIASAAAGDGPPGGDNGRKGYTNLSETPSNRIRDDLFACPFRKRDPAKYNVHDWQTCSLNPYRSITLVKQHLYRSHCVFQCSRCKITFDNKEQLETHQLDATICELSSAPLSDGITSDIQQQLMMRKPGARGAVENWMNIYRILFPTAPLPNSPYFEPPSEEELTLENTDRELDDYESYVRSQLPTSLRSALEATPNVSMKEPFGMSFEDLLQECQDATFARYREEKLASPSVPPLRSDSVDPTAISSVHVHAHSDVEFL